MGFDAPPPEVALYKLPYYLVTVRVRTAQSPIIAGEAICTKQPIRSSLRLEKSDKQKLGANAINGLRH